MIIYLLIKEFNIKKLLRYLILFLILPTILNSAPPPPRKHKTNQIFSSQNEYPANVYLSIPSEVSIKVIDKFRIIESNGIPNHKVGKFPNSGNPHSIKPQKYNFKIPLNPQIANNITSLENPRFNFGIALSGVLFDPLAREYYLGDLKSDWRYEATSGAIKLGLDTNNAHVQPNGSYHYHGLPRDLESELELKNKNLHSPLIGWAADGFPIYGATGYKDNKKFIINKSSYRIRQGKRPTGKSNPGGIYDGTFINDFYYVKDYGTLDQCNGRLSITPEFPNGTYAYFITDEFPSIPRCFKGTPSKDFLK
tara:strand:+ start:8103 stop:9026 length:924 start_codon:yes stop_codon:yes gene_type:complete